MADSVRSRRSNSTCRNKLAVFLAVACSVTGRSAHAVELALDSDRCAEYDGARLKELLTLELQTLSAGRSGRSATIQLVCSPGAIRVRVHEGDGRQVREAWLEAPVAAGDAETRALALAVTEIVADIWSATPARSQRAIPAQPRDEPHPPGRTERRQLHLSLGPTVQALGRPVGPLYLAALGVELELHRHLGVLVSAFGGVGPTETELAVVDKTMLGGSLDVLPGVALGNLRLALGPGVTLAFLRLRAAPKVPVSVQHDVTGIWAGLALRAQARWHIWERAFAQVDVQAGTTLVPVNGLIDGNDTLIAIDGAWGGGGMRAGFSF